MVLFNSIETASTHFTTTAQIEEAEALGLITEVPLPPASFHEDIATDVDHDAVRGRMAAIERA